MKYLFLDTNIYLHYIDFEQIKWKDICNCDEFCIVVPPIVIREIDKIKDTGRGKTQNRAKKTSVKFGNVFLEEKQGKVEMKMSNEPDENAFKNGIFNKNISDDWFVLSVISFDADKNDKIVIAADNNLLIKAKKK